MKYKVLTKEEHKEKFGGSYTSGTSKKGTLLNVEYTELLDKLGYPTSDDNIDDKTHVEWIILFEDGTFATLYDWYGITNHWSIGGHHGNVIKNMKKLFKEYEVEEYFIGEKFWEDKRYEGELLNSFKEV